MSADYLTAHSASLTTALALIDQQVPCFPCRADESPATPHGFKDAAFDRDALQMIWARHPGPLIGVPTGELSGLDVLDIDQRHRGGDWFAERRHRLPATRVHRTRSGGLHLIFQHAKGLRCSAGKIAAGIDVRATGGYVIWWPAAGLPTLSEKRVAPWPEWFPPLSTPRAVIPHIRVPDDHALMRLVRLVAHASPGERNNVTYWAACRAGEMVASGLLEAEVVASVIAEAATRAGLSRAEAERTAWSGVCTTGRLAHA
jgi:hypothetical protein